jgi:hypothetical protein
MEQEYHRDIAVQPAGQDENRHGPHLPADFAKDPVFTALMDEHGLQDLLQNG